MNTLPVLSLGADGNPVHGETFTVDVLTGDTYCSWCDDHGDYKITSDQNGWIDWACQYHREHYWTHGVTLIKA